MGKFIEMFKNTFDDANLHKRGEVERALTEAVIFLLEKPISGDREGDVCKWLHILKNNAFWIEKDNDA